MLIFHMNVFFFLLIDKILYLALWCTSWIIFVAGITGYLANLNNYIRILISIETLYVSLSCLCIATGLLFNYYAYFIYALFFIFFAAVEGAILLLLCVHIYYTQNEIYIEQSYKMLQE